MANKGKGSTALTCGISGVRREGEVERKSKLRAGAPSSWAELALEAGVSPAVVRKYSVR